MNPDDIKNLIDRLLQTAEILATKAFELSLRQVYSEIASMIVWAIVLLVMSLLLPKIIKQVYKKVSQSDSWTRYHKDSYPAYDDLSEPQQILVFFYQVARVLFGVILIIDTIWIIQRLINPQWYAIKILIETFKNL